jgi:hypothetical protein
MTGFLRGAICVAGVLSWSATAADWPPTLDRNPPIQPPKWDWQLAVPVKVNPRSTTSKCSRTKRTASSGRYLARDTRSSAKSMSGASVNSGG